MNKPLISYPQKNAFTNSRKKTKKIYPRYPLVSVAGHALRVVGKIPLREISLNRAIFDVFR